MRLRVDAGAVVRALRRAIVDDVVDEAEKVSKKALNEIVDTRTLLAAAEAKCKEAAKTVDDARQNMWVDPGPCVAAMQDFQTALEEVNRLKAKESELRAAIRAEQAADLEDA